MIEFAGPKNQLNATVEVHRIRISSHARNLTILRNHRIDLFPTHEPSLLCTTRSLFISRKFKTQTTTGRQERFGWSCDLDFSNQLAPSIFRGESDLWFGRPPFTMAMDNFSDKNAVFRKLKAKSDNKVNLHLTLFILLDLVDCSC